MKWLSALLTVCLLLGVPAAMMEAETPEGIETEVLELPVDEVALELGGEPAEAAENEDDGEPAENQDDSEPAEEAELILGEELTEIESEPLDAEEAIYGESIPIDAAHFPDPEFRKVLTDADEDYDADHDGVLSPAEIQALTSIYVDFNEKLYSVAGIEYFPNLESLNCNNTPIQSLDVSRNPKLEYLYCEGCKLTALDVSRNKGLTHLYCGENSLTTLDLSNNPELEYLWCSGNSMTALDVSKCSLLRNLECGRNNLRTLDLRNIGKLEYLNCMDNALTGLDLSGNPELVDLECSNNAITALDVRSANNLRTLGCANNGMTSLLIGSKDTLEEINCSTNLLNSLGVSKCPVLKRLYCDGNNLTTLDLSGVSLAQVVTNARKQDDGGGRLRYEAEGWNYDRYTLVVEASTQVITDAAAGGVPVDAAHFPDENFRQYILNNFDLSGDGSLSAKEIDKVREIDIEPYNGIDVDKITSLKGTEYLTALEAFHFFASYDTTTPVALPADLDLTKNTRLIELRFGDVNLSGMDFSKYPNLKDLEVNNAGLTRLDVSKNTALVHLSCQNNSLTTLDLSRNTVLEELYCDANKLTTLDVSRNGALRELSCGRNGFASLDVTHNSLLEELSCDRNPIKALDLSGNPAMKWLNINGTKIDQLDISHLSGLRSVECAATPMETLDISGCPILVNTYKYITPFKEYDDELGVYVLNYMRGEGEPTGELYINRDLKLIINRKELVINAENFPDANFRGILLMQADLDGNHVLSNAEIAAVDAIYCAGSNIASLAGLEHFTALHILECGNNPLTELDISRCPMLNACYQKGSKRDESATVVGYHKGDDALLVDKNVKIIADVVSTFALTKNDKYTMDVGAKLRLTLGDKTATGYKSSKTNIAAVSVDGVIEAKAAGKATITVTLTNKKKLKLTLTVVDPTIPTGLKLDKTGTIQHDLNQKLQLNATLEKVGIAGGGVNWKTSSSKVATVDDNGLVTPLKTGKVTITATAKKNRKASAKVTLNIFDPYAVTGIELDRKGTVTIDLKDTLTLAATLKPATARSDITWKSSSEKIATVKDGVVTPVKVGSVTITATAVKNKKSAKVKVVIKDLYAPKKIAIDQGKKLTLNKGETITLTATVEGEKGVTPRKNLTWSAANNKVTVDPATGKVTAKESGKVKVTVVTDNGKKASITITVAK